MSNDALYRFVERRHLPVELGGQLVYCHATWLQFQRVCSALQVVIVSNFTSCTNGQTPGIVRIRGNVTGELVRTNNNNVLGATALDYMEQ